RFLTEQDEQGLITYLTYKPSKTQQVEGYFIYRSDDVPSGTSTDMPAAWAQQADLYTLGGAWTRQIDDHWSYRIEGAVQQGNRNGRDLEAFGTNNRLTYAFKDEYQNTLRLGYEYVTGDDPDSADEDEQFDMLWGEWPRWSELYIYTYTKEGQVAENSNLHRIGIGHTFYPHKKLQVKSDYMALWADQDSGLGGDNKFRGHLLTCWMIYTHNAHIRGHLLGELLIPGDYYATDDNALFLRAQVELIF
nr:alginate export family protein [Phycisphaerae bacterium]